MFGFGKKSLIERMNFLYQKSQLAVYTYAKSKKCRVGGQILEGDEIGHMAAAISNFLCGHSHKQMHLDKFKSREIESIAYQLINKDQNLKELVVQSMRVYSIILYEEAGTHINTDILDKYGHEFPDAPDPSSYKSLIDRLDDWMPPSNN
mgnify:CR=1 FL=1